VSGGPGLPAPADVIPHRPPFLFVDALTALVPGESATGTWRLTGEEWFFGGHFPGRPTLPGVLMCEAIAQVGAIAVLTAERSRRLPEIATAREQGLRDVVASNWFAAFYPKGTPAGVVEKLRAAITAAMDTASMQTRMREIGAELVAPERRTPAYLQSFVAGEIAKWAVPIRTSGAIIE